MPKMQVPFVGQPYKMQAKQLDSQTCINWYVTLDSTGKKPHVLLPTDGLKEFTSIPDVNNVRGMLELNNDLYGVAGNKFFAANRNGDIVIRGTLRTSEKPVKLIPNNNQIFMTDGTAAYVYQYEASATRPIHDFFEVTQTASNIGNLTFTGSGLNDMSTSGTYIGDTLKNIRVEIIIKGTPDEFRWSEDNGDTWIATLPITSINQALGDEGIIIKFNSTTGHTLRDRWDFQASPVNTFYVPVVPAYQDGYGIYIKQNSDEFYISSINDFAAVNSLDNADEIIWPDDLQAAISVREELWLIGRTHTRIWYNTGNATFPFEPRTNLAIKYGTIAPYTVTAGLNNILFWLGNNEEGGRVALIIDSYAPTIISTEPLHNEWNRYDEVSDAIGFLIQKDGHMFYHLTFPSADKTWVYDVSTKLWHEKASTYYSQELESQDKYQGRWRGNNYAYFNGRHLVGDWKSNKIFELDNTKYTDDGMEIRRERVTKIIEQDMKRLFINSLEIDMEVGGLTNDMLLGNEPKVMLQISKDDGITWGNEKWLTTGKEGEYNKRLKWNRLGSARSFTFRIRTTDPNYFSVFGAVADIEVSD